ncbi:right-handed parallel beta-helix repeat-containing protein [Haliscomenobacter hydrossis]|uniref:Hemolysin-type calcium-binding region n=1 Tax=Haliscomenobacter hydrossis (strain ATCC 27775 / DSM 1100 / LMG 10767 / O) TaxID=760192 RepID=F4L8B0_HALH1|nr:hemolysin-type calcium-binding region [Haliscomenobacter hydrossis]AEE54618.1 hemolysin-type calcium-binding region [Haliscomenobacter hydrossis DSM 1100]
MVTAQQSFFCRFMILVLCSVLYQCAYARQYYLNSNSGNDSQAGIARDKAWKSLASLHQRNFLPGDTINFECGSGWDTGLEINDSGSPDKPIVFRAIGTGSKPVFSQAKAGGKAVNILSSYVILDAVLAKDAQYAAVNIAKGANHNIIRNCEMSNAGAGVMISGKYNLITQNYAHDLVMVKNTPGGDDDYGAVAFWVFNSNNEISYNRATRCRAPSLDYGSDGGFFEIYSNGDSSYVHHNYAEDCNGFLEVGGGTARHVMVSHNVSLENGEWTFHVSGKFRADIQDFRMEHNTIISKKGTKWNNILGLGRDAPNLPTVIFSHNLVIIGGESGEKVARHGNFTHENNTYFLLDGAQLGYTLHASENISNVN